MTKCELLEQLRPLTEKYKINTKSKAVD